MSFYLRKSVRVGPIRFNLSKSGVGISVGVKGLRYGIRPNGRRYVHAGRYGVYFRQELNGRQAARPALQTPPPTEPGKIVVHTSTSAAELSRSSRNSLIDELNESYRAFRLDVAIGVLFACVSLFAFKTHWALGLVSTVAGLATTIWVVYREKARRTIVLDYEFDEQQLRTFRSIVDAVNLLASCHAVWVMESHQTLESWHRSKHHGGASRLVTRTGGSVGAGTPPWLVTNVTIPAVVAKGQTLYFLPDGILVYDDSGAAHLDYSALRIEPGAAIYIEDDTVPSDASIVGYTWLHPNKDGGPDRRFSTNRQIPKCRYGEILISASGGLQILLQTSRDSVPVQFKAAFHAATKAMHLK